MVAEALAWSPSGFISRDETSKSDYHLYLGDSSLKSSIFWDVMLYSSLKIN
jgi:hypothetical protein